MLAACLLCGVCRDLWGSFVALLDLGDLLVILADIAMNVSFIATSCSPIVPPIPY